MPWLDDEVELIGRGRAQSDGGRRAFDAGAKRGDASAASRWYDASDSEREQPGWRVPKSTSLAAERGLQRQGAAEANGQDTDTDTTDTDTSARDTDDESLLEGMAVAARRTARTTAGIRRWRRHARGDRSRVEEAQRRWDTAMARPLCSSESESDDDDDVAGVTGASS